MIERALEPLHQEGTHRAGARGIEQIAGLQPEAGQILAGQITAALPQVPNEAAFAVAASGWRNAGPNVIEAKSPSLPVTAGKVFEFSLQPVAPTTSVSFACDNGSTRFGESIYVSGDIPELGSFDPAQARKLEPDVYYEYIWNPPSGSHPGPSTPIWTGSVGQLPPNTTFRWRCLRQRADGVGTPTLGALQMFATGASGYAGRSAGSL